MGSTPDTVVAIGGGYISDETVEGFRSNCLLAIVGYCPDPCTPIPSPLNDIERGGGAGYEDQETSSRGADSLVTGAFHPADGGAWGVYGEKDGVIGDS